MSSMTRIALPALIAMVTVAGFVGAAEWNASGQPRLVLTVTERELQLPYRLVGGDEEPALRLRVDYAPRYEPLDARNWLPESRLREIGFALNVPAGSPQAAAAYDRVPPRLAWIVFEYDGPQWRDLERRRRLTEQRFPGRLLESRLVPVDAGSDFDALRARYSSGHLIMRGVVGLSYVSATRGGPLVYGTLRQIVPSSVAVPRRLHATVAGLRPPESGDASEPRYEAELAIGRLGLPYLRSLRSRN
jgi:hypothetical protein